MPQVRQVADAFLFGPIFLVFPILSYQQSSIPCYLPIGSGGGDSGFFDFWTGKKHAAGTTVTQAVVLDHIPLFVVAGTIVPFGPYLLYSSEKQSDPLELRIYRGEDAAFTLYEVRLLLRNYFSDSS